VVLLEVPELGRLADAVLYRRLKLLRRRASREIKP
jgi:hypothetical protein